MTEALAAGELFPLVLADPPYIPSPDTGTYPEDPLTAIDGGTDGLALARLCLEVGAAHLLPGGHLLVQLRDAAQAAQLAGEAPAVLEQVEVREFEGRGAVLHLRRTTAVGAMLERAREGLDRVAPEDLAAELASGALVVDTRPVEQRDRDGELPGAVVVDRNVLEWRLDPTSPHRIPQMTGPDVRVVVVCNEGFSSSLAAASLQELGLRRATDLVGGYQAWRMVAGQVGGASPAASPAAGGSAAGGSPDH
jgi:rhodanese-related sulfurtransferase